MSKEHSKAWFWGSVLATTLVALFSLIFITFEAFPVSLLDRQAGIRAVGDEGCLGRTCKLSANAAAKDLSNFFDNFLDKGPHSGGKTKHVLKLESKLAKKQILLKLSDKSASKDLDKYYDSLPKSKSEKVVKSEVKSEFVHLLADSQSRQDLDNYYDSLKTGPGRKAKILEAEMEAKRKALQMHLEGVQRRKEEEKHMLQIEAASVIQAKKDKKQFAKGEAIQESTQESGHMMEAVPSSRESAKQAKVEANKFFDSLQKEVHKTGKVLRTEKAAEDQAAADLAKAAHRESSAAAPSLTGKKGWLSAEEDKEVRERFFQHLAKKVHKTKRVLEAEAHAVTEAQRDMENAKDSSAAHAARAEHVTSHALSREQAEADQNRYFESLDHKVHKTARILHAEARARAIAVSDARAAIAVDGASVSAAATAKPAVGDKRLSARESRAELDNAIDAIPTHKRAPPKVRAAVADRPLTAVEARRELNRAVDSFPVHKTAAVLRAEAHAAAQAAADKAYSVKETPAGRAVHSRSKPRRLSATAAAAQQTRYFHSLAGKVHKTASVLRAEALATAAAALPGRTSRVGSLTSRAEMKTRLSARASRTEQDHYFQTLNQQVHKTRKVLLAEASAKQAAARAARRAAPQPARSAPPAVGDRRLSADEARRELNSDVDALPARSAALPRVAPAVADKRLSAREARDELDHAMDAFPVHKTAAVLHAESQARKEAKALAQSRVEEPMARQALASSRPQRLSDQEARKQLDHAFDALPARKRPLPHVQPAVDDRRLSADEARKELQQSVDALPVHKTQSVLLAERAANAAQEQRKRELGKEEEKEPTPAAEQQGGRKLSAEQARKELSAAIDSLPTHLRALPHVQPAVGDRRMSADEARKDLGVAMDALPVHKTATVLAAEEAAQTASAARRASDRAADMAPRPVAVAAVGDTPLSADEARKELDAAVDALPHHKQALPHVRAAVGDDKLSGEDARKELDASVDALPHEKKPLRHVAPAVGDEKLSTADARKELDASVDALPHEKKPLPHVAPAVGDEKLSTADARKELDASVDALPHEKQPLPHVAPAVSSVHLSTAESRHAMAAAMDALPHGAPHPLPHGRAAVPAGKLGADAARLDMDRFFAGLPATRPRELPQGRAAVGDARLAALASRRALIRDLQTLHHS